MNGSTAEPQVPADPYAQYRYMAMAQQAPGNRQQMANQLAKSIMGQPAQNAALGAGQLIAGAGVGLRDYMNKQYPAAPGGAQPSFMTGLANLFSGGNNGGLY